jgi:AcrR family transcriptional regulator
MMSRDQVLDAMERLTLERGRLPSILEVATAVGLTKQGVLHHFPTRAALDAAVVRRALTRVDEAMAAAAAHGSPVETYLRLSTPTSGDRVAALVLAAALLRGNFEELPPEVTDAVARWQDLIAEEVGDRVQAEVVRLVGDGLFGEALLTGAPPSADRVERLVTRLKTDATERHP